MRKHQQSVMHCLLVKCGALGQKPVGEKSLHIKMILYSIDININVENLISI